MTVTDISAFPADFRWGVATAAYQIEGAVAEGGRGASIWDTFTHTPGLVVNGDTGDIADDHYHRWNEDLDLMVSLGVTHYRMSLAWSRLQPTGVGELNSEGLAFYRDLLTGMRERGIQPLVTLYHWDLPQALEDRGGWPSRDTAYRFADYASRVIAELGHLASDWITINEPWCVSFLGYGNGAHAPGKSDIRLAVAAAHHVNLAHGLALASIRTINPALRVSNSNLVTDIVAATDSDDDAAAVLRLDAMNNRIFLDPIYLGSYSAIVHEIFDEFGLDRVVHDGDLALIGAPVDFMGLNHYQRVVVSADEEGGYLRLRERAAEPATTSFGWSVEPDSLRSVLARVTNDFTQLPIYVTENGASYDDYADPNGDVNDWARVEYFSGYLSAAAVAIREGANLQGYYAWSFLDNFEWAEGYSKRFGLVYVDYPTQVRIPKRSALWYRQLIADHESATAPTASV
ncbi:MAG: GH1 family beta-glucosidase [Microbacteriaceae bacterium]